MTLETPLVVQRPTALTVLLVQARAQICALRVEHVIETMRPLPLRRIEGASSPVLGLAVVRGEAIPVVDLGALLGAEAPATPTRFVIVRGSPRAAALCVEGVLMLRTLEEALISKLPPLLRQESSRPIQSTLSLDAELVLLLRAARLVPEEVWSQIAALERNA